jgi:hypothetical protein
VEHRRRKERGNNDATKIKVFGLGSYLEQQSKFNKDDVVKSRLCMKRLHRDAYQLSGSHDAGLLSLNNVQIT